MIYRAGINDMPYGWTSENELNKRIYKLWHHILERCYSEREHKRNPTYKDCYVCDKWLKLSGFVEDVSKIPNYNKWVEGFKEKRNPYELDKDIKIENNKCYSLGTCLFVTRSENVSKARKGKTPNRRKPLPEKIEVLCFDKNGNFKGKKIMTKRKYDKLNSEK